MTVQAPITGEPSAADTPLGTLHGEWPLQGPVDLRPAIYEVRRMPEFQPVEPGWWDQLLGHPAVRAFTERFSGLLESLTDAINRFLARLIPPGIAGLPDNIRDIFSGFLGFLLVLMGLYAFYILLGWLLRLWESQEKPPPAEPRLFDVGQLVSSRFHYQQARAKAAKGQFDRALHQLYLALLCLLDERGLVPFEQARSNGEYLSQIADADLREQFRQLSRRFEASRYGGQAVRDEDFQSCLRVYQTLQEADNG